MGDYKMRMKKFKMMHNQIKNEKYKVNCQKRGEAFERFKNKYFRLSEKYSSYEELAASVNKYSAYLVGSDQLWKPDSIEQGYYTLDFVPDNIKKISYATSFGVKKLPHFQIKKAKNFLNRFDRISVREQSGKKIVDEISDKSAEVVLDPTLLLDKNEWGKILEENKSIIETPYIFVYLLGNNPEHREIIKKVKSIKGYPIVALLHVDEYIAEDEEFADISPYDVDPSEFLSLIKNAEYIFTDSFHASVFSIIFEKQFFTFNRFNESNKNGTNTRIDNLMEITGLGKRRMSNITDSNLLEEKIESKILYDEVKKRISECKKSSLAFLKSAFEIEGGNGA